ncbi:SpoIIIAC/SpoIIIAD family protein [Fusicatenibacter sp.]|mgnify:CR=1 FL=1
MEMLRIAALGTAGVLLGITVKGAKPEYAVLVSICAGLCILRGTVGKMQYLLEMLTRMKSYLPVDSSYLNTLLKMLGITYVGQFCAGICKDAGYSSIAGQIELFSRLSVLAFSMPVLLALLETVHEFL